MLAGASAMALVSFGHVAMAARIIAWFAELCSRLCAGEPCVVTSLCWQMQAYTEARWCAFGRVGLNAACCRGCAVTCVIVVKHVLQASV